MGKTQHHVYNHTCNVQRRVPTDDAHSCLRISRVAVVGPYVGRRTSRFRRNDAKEEQLTARQQHPVNGRVLIGRHDHVTVSIPRDHRVRSTLGLAVERRRFVAGDVLVFGVFDDVGVGEVADSC